MMAVVALLACTSAALFVSGILAFAAYALAVLFLPSIFVCLGSIGPVAFRLSMYGVSAIAASIGAFLVWFDHDIPLRYNLLRFALALTTAVLGAWLGLQYNKTVDLPSSRYLEAEHYVLVLGAIFGGNVPPLAFGLLGMSRRGL